MWSPPALCSGCSSETKMPTAADDRNSLVLRAEEQLVSLGMLLVPVTSHRPWLAECDAIRAAYNTLAATVRALEYHVYVPGAGFEIEPPAR